MKHRRKIVVGIGAMALSLGMLAAPGTASAGTYGVLYLSGGRVEFIPDGDTFKVHDTSKDSHGVGVQWQYGDYGVLEVNNNGAHTTKSFKHATQFAEGKSVRFRACLTENSKVWSCGSYITVKA